MKIPIIQPLIIHLKGSVEFSQGLEGDTQEHEVDFHLWVTKMICQAMTLPLFSTSSWLSKYACEEAGGAVPQELRTIRICEVHKFFVHLTSLCAEKETTVLIRLEYCNALWP